MNNYFYKQFKRLFDLNEIQHRWFDDLNQQFEWATNASEIVDITDLRLTTRNALMRTRKQLIDRLCKKLMIRIRRVTCIDVMYKNLLNITYIDNNGEQSNLYGNYLPDDVTRGRKGVILILMYVLMPNRKYAIVQTTLSESEEDKFHLIYGEVI